MHENNQIQKKSNAKKGIIFAITLFLLSSVLLDFTIYVSEHNTRHDPYFTFSSDANILNSKISELSLNAQRALGVKPNMLRNSTHLTLRFEDSGFAFAPAGSGTKRADLDNFGSFYSSTWANSNNLSCSFNFAITNSSGIYYQTSDKINYSHDNSDSSSDSALFSIPSGYEFSHVRLDIYCLAPDDYDDVSYGSWASTSSPKSVIINYIDDEGHTQFQSLNFDQSVPQLFYVNYTVDQTEPLEDYSSQAVYFALSPSNILNLSDSHTTSKSNVNCTWNLTAIINYAGTSSEHLFIPITTNISYNDARYVGYLPVSKK